LTKDNINRPLVSIITPSYNQGKFIEETILSVKRQNYSEIEHIIVDGCSTDNTLDVIKNYDGEYNLRWISEKDNGQADAINKGFSMAEGNIVGWLNSDDIYFYKNSISSVVKTFNLFPDMGIIYGHAAKINQDSKLLRIKVVPEFNLHKLKMHNFIIQPSCFWRSDVCKNNLLDLSMDCSFDYEYWLRLGGKYKWRRINKVLSADRNHLDRKIIAELDKSILETRQLRTKMGIRPNLISVIKRKIGSFLARLKGLFFIFNIYYQKDSVFTLKLSKKNIYKLIKTQLLKKERDLL